MTIKINEGNKVFTLTKKEFQDYNKWLSKQIKKQIKFMDKIDERHKENDDSSDRWASLDGGSDRWASLMVKTVDLTIVEKKYPTTVKEWILKGGK